LVMPPVLPELNANNWNKDSPFKPKITHGAFGDGDVYTIMCVNKDILKHLL